LEFLHFQMALKEFYKRWFHMKSLHIQIVDSFRFFGSKVLNNWSVTPNHTLSDVLVLVVV